MQASTSSIKKSRKRTLHWEPIEEDVAGTVWAKAAALEEIAPTIPKVEYIEELHKLFGKKKNAKGAKKMKMRKRKRKRIKKQAPDANKTKGQPTILTSTRAQVIASFGHCKQNPKYEIVHLHLKKIIQVRT